VITHQDDRERDDREHGDRGTQARLSTESFEGFFGRYWPWLNRILISQASDSATAEDVALATFESAWGHWDDLLTYDRPDSWLYKVAIRRLRRLESKARDRGSLAEDPAGNEADLCHAASTDDWVASNLDLVAALRLLPRRQAEVVTVKWLAECTVKETAEILGVTEGTVKKQLSRAMEKLRVLLDDPAVTDTARRNHS
jgi:RNA polymerase sigma factor (sigma-70 family)